MIKEVRYNGYAANPSEYQSADGDLGVAMNLVPEDGGLKLMEGGTEAHQWSEGMSALYIHRSSQYKHIIYTDGSIVYWAEMSETDNSFEEDAGNKVIGLAEGEEVRGIVAIGNTLIITTSESMRYVLWRDEKYIDLGSKLPFVGIEFDMDESRSKYTKEVTDIFTEVPLSIGFRVGEGGAFTSEIEETSENRKAALKSMSEAIYGLVLKETKDNVTKQGLFYQPMMVRYALKMYDGTYMMHSAPVLMLPTVCIPKVVQVEASGSGGKLTVKSRLELPRYTLKYRIVGNNPLDIEKWKDVIQGVDIFVSAPIYTWDQSQDMSVTAQAYMLQSLAKYEYINAGEDVPNPLFAGHYDGKDWFVDNQNGENLWNIHPNETFYEDVKTISNFYHIASMEIGEIALKDDFENLKLLRKDLTALETLPTLDDDYNSHSKLEGGYQYAYNNRLNIANVKYTPGAPYPIRTMVPNSSPLDYATYNITKITVWLRKDGERLMSTQVVDTTTNKANPYIYEDIVSNFPRWIYYPDANAYQMKIEGGGKSIIIPLKPHNFLNGAYWWGGIKNVEDIIPNEYNEESIAQTSVQMGNKLYTSEAENPWVFPASGVRAIGDGDIIGIASAARALSEGQFGQFPLYAFTTEGVWALSVNDTGTFNPAQPISRDVCVDADSITQIDQSVLFATNRGVMMIAGSETICMTDGIDTDSPMLLRKMPGGSQLMAKAEIGSRTFDMVAFKDYLQGARMVYDYTHQRIVLYQPLCDYAYVYSLKSKQWGMMESKIQYGVNSYPEALVVTSDNKLVDLSSAEGELMRKGLMVTRALKLDGGDILKTIDTIIQRGDFDRGDVSTVLWGSRDLKHWHLIWTSKDHYLRGFRGSPYKYYRIGAIAKIGREESLIGASINYQLKQTNKLR